MVLLLEQGIGCAGDIQAILAAWSDIAVIRVGSVEEATTAARGTDIGLLVAPASLPDGMTGCRLASHLGGGQPLPAILIAGEADDDARGGADAPCETIPGCPLDEDRFRRALDSALAHDTPRRAPDHDPEMLIKTAESSPFPVIVLDREGLVVHANYLARRLLELPHDGPKARLHESPGWKFMDFNGNPLGDEMLPFLVAARGVPVYGARVAVGTPGGRRLFLSVNCLPSDTAECGAGRVMMSLNDITEWVRIDTVIKHQNQRLAMQNLELQTAMYELDRREKMLALSEEKFAKAFKLNPVIMTITRLSDGLVVEVNDAFCAQLGYSREGVIGKDAHELGFHALTPGREWLVDTLKNGGSVIEQELHVRAAAGETHTGMYSASLMDIGGEPHIVSMFRDITAQKEAEAKLEREMAILEALTLLSGTLIARSYTIPDVAAMVLRNARWLTLSEHGFVSQTDPTGGKCIGHALVTGIEGGCGVAEGARAFEFCPGPDGTYAGLWGHALNTGKAFFTNDPAGHPARGACPPGHVPVGNFMGVPVMLGDEILGEIALANSTRGYTTDDLEAVKRLAQLYAFAIHRLRAEERVTSSLREKEVLLKEVHHRVKNNLQIIHSLFSLQARTNRNAEVTDVLRSSQNRIRTMSLIHEKLYKSGDFARIDLSDYVRTFAGELHAAHSGIGARVSLKIDALPVSVELAIAIPCGLIMNELISNAFKHAFPEDWPGQAEIRVDLKMNSDDMIELTVADNGCGMAPGIEFMSTDTLGLKLVSILGEEQLKGTLVLVRDSGTAVTLRFKAD